MTHEAISRTLQGAYAAMPVHATLARSHRQDRIYRLHGGRVDEISCETQPLSRPVSD